MPVALRVSFLARAPAALRLRPPTAHRARILCSQMATNPSSEERFDVLNADGSLAGHSKPRSAVHRDGDLHRSTHIWVLSASTAPARLLLQLRSADKDTFPGRWDVSAAGHVAAGDESRPSAEREVAEELGLRVGEGGGRLEFAFSARAVSEGEAGRHGRFVDNEIQDVYVFRRGREVEVGELALQEEEVADVRYWSWEEFREAQRRGDDRFVPRSKEYMRAMEEGFDGWAERAKKELEG